jgi:hypothetical protein
VGLAPLPGGWADGDGMTSRACAVRAKPKVKRSPGFCEQDRLADV